MPPQSDSPMIKTRLPCSGAPRFHGSGGACHHSGVNLETSISSGPYCRICQVAFSPLAPNSIHHSVLCSSNSAFVLRFGEVFRCTNQYYPSLHHLHSVHAIYSQAPIISRLDSTLHLSSSYSDIYGSTNFLDHILTLKERFYGPYTPYNRIITTQALCASPSQHGSSFSRSGRSYDNDDIQSWRNDLWRMHIQR